MLRHRDLLTAALLGFSSGYVTSNTKLRFDTFGGMMTGNTVKLGMALANGEWDKVAVYLCVLSCFALGTLFALLMVRAGKFAQRMWLALFCAALLLVDVLALTISPHGAIYQSVVSSLAAIALGAQNCLSQKSGVTKANTTFMTGNIQKMVEAAFVGCTKGLSRTEARAALLLLLTWSCYVLGGGVGAAVASCGATFCTTWSLTPATLLYAGGMLSLLIERPKAPPADQPAQAAGRHPPEQHAPPEAAALVVAPATTPPAAAEAGAAQVALELRGGAAVSGGRAARQRWRDLLHELDSIKQPHPLARDGTRELGESAQL
jgi:uncharacterized membrane protein YoaK (UPF0700 family)